MNPILIDFVLGPIFCVAGVLAGVFLRGVPMRGWIALALLLLSALIWTFSEPRDSSASERTWLLPCFTFIAPLAVIYSFRARKHAPDRMLSRTAFIASFVIAAAFLFMLAGMIYGLALVISSPNTALEPTPTAL